MATGVAPPDGRVGDLTPTGGRTCCDRMDRILPPCLPTGSVVAGSLPGTCHDEGNNGIGQFQPP